jgi:hypothetical protein
MRNQGGEQGGKKVIHPRRVLIRSVERLGEPTPRIDLGQQVFDPHPGQRALNGPAQVFDPRWKFKCIALFEMQTALSNRGKRIVGQSSFSLLSDRITRLGRLSPKFGVPKKYCSLKSTGCGNDLEKHPHEFLS